MKKANRRRSRTKSRNEMLPEYDFRGGVRGKYAARYAKGTNIVLLAPDLARHFPTPESVNNALRALVEMRKALDRNGARRRRSA